MDKIFVDNELDKLYKSILEDKNNVNKTEQQQNVLYHLFKIFDKKEEK